MAVFLLFLSLLGLVELISPCIILCRQVEEMIPSSTRSLLDYLFVAHQMIRMLGRADPVILDGECNKG